MDVYSSMVVFVEYFAVEEASIVNDLQQLLFGSLTRPPQSNLGAALWSLPISLGQNYSFPCLLVMWNHALLFLTQGCAYCVPHCWLVFPGRIIIGKVNDVVVWKVLETGYVHGEGEIWLERMINNLECVLDRTRLEICLDNHVYTLIDYGLMFSSRECNRDVLVYHLCELPRVCPFLKNSAGLFEASLVYIAKSLIVLDDSHNLRACVNAIQFFKSINHEFKELHSFIDLLEIFQELLCVDIVSLWSLRDIFHGHNGQFKTMETTFDQCSFLLVCLSHVKVASHFSTYLNRIDMSLQCPAIIWCVWLLDNDEIKPPASHVLSSQGELRSTFGHEAWRYTLLWFALVYLDELMVQQFQFCSTSIYSHEVRFNAYREGEVARQWPEFNGCCEVLLAGQRGDCLFTCHNHISEDFLAVKLWFFHWCSTHKDHKTMELLVSKMKVLYTSILRGSISVNSMV